MDARGLAKSHHHTGLKAVGSTMGLNPEFSPYELEQHRYLLFFFFFFETLVSSLGFSSDKNNLIKK